KNCANISYFERGIYMVYSNNVTVYNVSLFMNTAGTAYGIALNYTSNSNLTEINSSQNDCGVYLYYSQSNILTNITANLNSQQGIYLIYSSQGNILTNITANSNSQQGIYIYTGSGNTSITYATVSSNGNMGISLWQTSSNRLTNITATENAGYDLFVAGTLDSHCSNTVSNFTGSGNRPIKYYNSSVSLSNEVLAELELCNADNSNITNVTIIGSASIKNNGMYLAMTDNSNLTGVNSSYRYMGIDLSFSSNNSFTNATLNYNSQYGILIQYDSDYNNITGSRLQGNTNSGIYLGESGSYDPEYNRIWNNYLNNTLNVQIVTGITNANYFNVSKNCSSGTNIIGGPCIGGNYWTDPVGGNFSDGCIDTSPADGICDSEYNLSVGSSAAYDYLPLTYAIPTVLLESPANNTINTTDSTPDFRFNVSGWVSSTYNCSLYTNRTGTGTPTLQAYNSSTLNATSTTMTASSNLANGNYDWWVNCTDNSQGRTNQSEKRNISISLGAPSVFLESPANNTINTTDSTPDFKFNVSYSLSGTFNCSLYTNLSVGGTPTLQAYNSSTLNSTSTTLTPSSN
ncbi:MAG: right-handed parallel beta-helix repeat-containing protein, partial [Candidatus Aenigmarchaeota archaeon]|nr:right-handed parallel beta-helix repeat-containing protein [Candidatus Aenigmarchaeota archaeon]